MNIREINTKHVRTIQYENPPHGYLNAKGSGLLLKAVKSAIEDDEVRVIVLTGKNDVFIRHYDVSDIVKAGEALLSGAIDKTAFATAPFAQLTSLIAAAPKPVIAAINGLCMGGGFELALACDIRVSATSVSQIGLPETRLDIFPGGGGTQRLPRMIGEAAALNFILQGMVVDANQAYKIGLVTEIADDALQRAMILAADLSEKGAAGLAAAKMLIREALSQKLEAGFAMEQSKFASLICDENTLNRLRDFCADPSRDILKP